MIGNRLNFKFQHYYDLFEQNLSIIKSLIKKLKKILLKNQKQLLLKCDYKKKATYSRQVIKLHKQNHVICLFIFFKTASS